MNYELARLLDGSRWLMQPSAFVAMIQRAMAITPEAVAAAQAAYGQRPAPAPQLVGDVGVIRVCGPVVYRSSWLSDLFGCASIQDLQLQLRAALADPAVRAVVWQFDTPGGTVEMLPEFAEELYQARGQKPMVAVADTLVASAGYWLAAQVDTIYASASSRLGSIGVYCEHVDLSGMLEKAGVKITLISHGARKTDGNPYEPLSEEARAGYQDSVDEVGGWFEQAVARGRGVTRAQVLERFGQGQVFRGKQAIALGLADRAGTFAQVLGKLTKGRTGGVQASAAALAGVVAKKRADVMDPVDGECEDGYELGKDGMCHVVPPEEDQEARRQAADQQARQDAADAEALAIATALGDGR